MAQPMAPKIIYGSGPTTLNMTHASAKFTPDRFVVGGGTEAASGVPETFVIRKDGLLALTLVVDESEVAAVTAWIDWVMDNGSLGYFTYYPDQGKSLNYQCWLVKPKIAEKWGFRRHDSYLRAYQLDLELRTRATGDMFDLRLS